MHDPNAIRDDLHAHEVAAPAQRGPQRFPCVTRTHGHLEIVAHSVLPEGGDTRFWRSFTLQWLGWAEGGGSRGMSAYRQNAGWQ